ncbi:MAG: DUF502 domain-containing protein [Alphaproteobacteria bacterium]|nr:DUF502 domain-containing protein [Alphaproteobacteria bacterium]
MTQHVQDRDDGAPRGDHPDGPDRKRRKFFDLRTNLLTGIILAAPIGITIGLTYWFVTTVDTHVRPLIKTLIRPLLPPGYDPDTFLPLAIPGIGVLFVILALIILGALTRNLFGRTLISFGERIVDRMPVIRSIYGALKQIFETVLSQTETSFKEVCLVEYPRRGLWALAFVATGARGEVADHLTPDHLSVFLPTTPNPTSGFLLFVPRQDVILLDMSVEDGAKLIISAGLVVPPRAGETKAYVNGRAVETRRRRGEPPAGAIAVRSEPY